MKKSSAKLIPENAVLLTTRAPIGYVAIAKTTLATNQGFKNLICNPSIADFSYIYYLLKNNTALLQSHSSGATFKELPLNRLAKIVFDLPGDFSQFKIC